METRKTMTTPPTTHTTEETATEQAADAIALIGQGIQALRAATEGHDAVRARAYTRALRELVGSGPRDSDAAVWTRVLRREREHAMSRLLGAGGMDTADVAVMCAMTAERVRQIAAGGAGTSRRPTGRPAGRSTPATFPATTVPDAAA